MADTTAATATDPDTTTTPKSYITKIMDYIKSIKMTTWLMIIVAIIAIGAAVYMKTGGKLSFFGAKASVTPASELLS